MNSIKTGYYPLLYLITSIFIFLLSATSVKAFRFVAWGDTKTATADLTILSNQVKALTPPAVFTLYAGDLVETWSQANFDLWKTAINGGSVPGNQILNLTFPVRGNHEGSGSTTGWQNNLNLRSTAQNIGATNYAELTTDITFSFDYQNSHIIGLDVLGDASLLSTAQQNWLDTDLTQAETRGIKHSFIVFHGPLYCTNGHCTCTARVCTPTNTTIAKIITIINNHPSVSAIFHGHEHVVTWTHIDTTRIPEVTHEYEQIISGSSGAGPSTPTAARVDYSLGAQGFVVLDVTSDQQFTATFYKQGNTSPSRTQTFTKPGLPSPTPTRTPTPTITPTPVAGDYDSDRDVDFLDLSKLIANFNSITSTFDFNHDGTVSIGDFTYLFQRI